MRLYYYYIYISTCVFIYINTHTPIYIYIKTHTYIHTYKHRHIHAYIYIQGAMGKMMSKLHEDENKTDIPIYRYIYQNCIKKYLKIL